MKHVTALYRSHGAATRVRDEIVAAGVEAGAVRIIPENAPQPGVQHGTKGDMEALHDLGLPEDDVRTYQHAVRNGDTVVTAHVDDEQAELAQAAMRDPDHGRDVEALRTQYAEEQLIAPAGRPLGAVGATSTVGLADDGRQTYSDPLEPRDDT